jgi:UDP-N-acetylglucosamine 4-epimerase
MDGYCSGVSSRVRLTVMIARTSLNELFVMLQGRLVLQYSHLRECVPVHRDFLNGDVLHSQVDISKAAGLLGYAPSHSIDSGFDTALPWNIRNLDPRSLQTP